MRSLVFGVLLATTLAVPADESRLSPADLQQRGIEHFFAGRMEEAVADWDRVIAAMPAQGPRHWQRGLALYYLGEFEKGVAQFESHQAVNSNDVENAVWHFLCVAKAPGGSVQKARKKFIPIEGDKRVPMKEVHELFAGTGTPEAVLEAAVAGDPAPPIVRNRLCFAHLYLGLYYEALGENANSAMHIKKAAIDHRMDHYMGKVAQVHLKLRSGETSKPEP